MKITLSTKHLKLRIVLFVVFFIIAVVAFTNGVVNIGKKSAGYHTITANTDADALTYNNAVTFNYYFDGSSNEIKREIKELTSVYTSLLSSAYKSLDCVNQYNGVVSIGAINSNLGSTVSVSPQLYEVLKDAYAKTLENKGYNMFAGALYSEWQSILILDEPLDFDPYFNDFEAKRISDIAAMVNDLTNFKLEFLDEEKCLVRFDVSPAYKDFCTEYEIEAVAINLNLLKDAYMFDMLAKGLTDNGYNLGYLANKEGLAVCLSSRGTLQYDLYYLKDGKEEVFSTAYQTGVFSAASFTSFGYGSPYGYSFEIGNDIFYRHQYFDVRNGEFNNVIMSLSIISDDMNIVENAYQCIIFNTLNTKSEVEYYKNRMGSSLIISYAPQ